MKINYEVVLISSIYGNAFISPLVANSIGEYVVQILDKGTPVVLDFNGVYELSSDALRIFFQYLKNKNVPHDVARSRVSTQNTTFIQFEIFLRTLYEVYP